MGCKRKVIVKKKVFQKLLCYVIISFMFLSASIVINFSSNVTASQNPVEANWTDSFNEDYLKIDTIKSQYTTTFEPLDEEVRLQNTYPNWPDSAWESIAKIEITNNEDYSPDDPVVYCYIEYQGGMQLNFDDIRFIKDLSSDAWFDYYIEKKVDGYYAHVWVETQGTLSSQDIIYMFYENGDENLVSDSNFDSVFNNNQWESEWSADQKINSQLNIDAHQPVVSYGNTAGDDEFLVVWKNSESDIRGSIWSVDGGNNAVVEDAEIFDDAFQNENPSVDYGDDSWLVVWDHHPGGENIYGRIVKKGSSGFVFLPSGDPYINVNDDQYIQKDPNVCFGTDNDQDAAFLVTWLHQDTQFGPFKLYGTFIDSGGYKVGGDDYDPWTFDLDVDIDSVWVAYNPDDNEYMIVWEQEDTIKASRFSDDLTKIEPTYDVASTTGITYENPCVEYCAATQKYLVTWDTFTTSYQETYGALIDPTEATPITNIYDITTVDSRFSNIIPYLKTHFVVSSVEQDISLKKVYGRLVDSEEETNRLSIFSLAKDSDTEIQNANMGFFNNKIFVAWEDTRSDSSEVYANIWNLVPDITTSVTYIDKILEADLISNEIPIDDSRVVDSWGDLEVTYEKGKPSGDFDFYILKEGGNKNDPLAGPFDIASGGTQSLSGISNSNQRIRVMAKFQRSDLTYTPALQEWKVTYTYTEGNGGSHEAEDTVGYWKFDEGIGSTVEDSSEYKHFGTFYGTASWLLDEGIDGDALSINGIDDYVSIGNLGLDLFEPPANAQSFNIWIKPSTAGGTATLESPYITDHNDIGYITFGGGADDYNNELVSLHGDIDRYTAVFVEEGFVLTNEWHMITITWNENAEGGDGRFDIYFDGVIQEGVIGGGDGSNHCQLLDLDPTDFIIGTDSGKSYVGYIDEVKVYSVPLDSPFIYNDLWCAATGCEQLSPPPVNIGYDITRIYYKGGDNVEIFANFTAFPTDVQDVIIKIEDIGGNEIGNDYMTINPNDNDGSKWIYNWNVPSTAEYGKITVTVYAKYAGDISMEVEKNDEQIKKIDNSPPSIDRHYFDLDTEKINIYFSEICSSILEWGNDKDYGNTINGYGTMVYNELSGLSENSYYFYKITAYDQAYNPLPDGPIESGFLYGTESPIQDEEEQSLFADANGPYKDETNSIINFDGSGSDITNTSRFITAYLWDFHYENDNFEMEGLSDISNPKINYSYSEPGNYTVALKVYDDQANYDIDTTTAEIIEISIIEIDDLNESQKFGIPQFDDTIIIHVEVTPAKNIPDVKITISDHGNNKPEENIQEPTIDDIKKVLEDDPIFEDKEIVNIITYRYVDIDMTSDNTYVPKSDIDKTYLLFRVQESWIKSNNISKESITMLRYNNSKWENLSTDYIETDDDYSMFYSKTKGFSTFAVVGSEVVEQKQDETENEPIPWIIIIGFIAAAIIALVFILFKTKFIYIEDKEVEEKTE